MLGLLKDTRKFDGYFVDAKGRTHPPFTPTKEIEPLGRSGNPDVVYVNGDVTITGTVEGQGAIVATGKITVTGTMDTQADHAALVAKDDITIHGDGPNSSKFQGLVYSEGSIDIARTTIMGAAVSKDTAGTTKLEEVKAISVPELTKMDFEVHSTLKKSQDNAAGLYDGTAGESIGIMHNGMFTPLDFENTEALKALGAELGPVDLDGDSWQMVIKRTPNDFVVKYPFASGTPADAKLAWNNWYNYLKEHKDNKVETEEFFSIDLNTLISLDIELEMMYHTTVSNTSIR